MVKQYVLVVVQFYFFNFFYLVCLLLQIAALELDWIFFLFFIRVINSLVFLIRHPIIGVLYKIIVKALVVSDLKFPGSQYRLFFLFIFNTSIGLLLLLFFLFIALTVTILDQVIILFLVIIIINLSIVSCEWLLGQLGLVEIGVYFGLVVGFALVWVGNWSFFVVHWFCWYLTITRNLAIYYDLFVKLSDSELANN